MGQGFLTPRTARRVVAPAVLGAAAVVACARPLVYEVDGVSMAPGLVPGDRVASPWFPWRDRLRSPRRFERWVHAAADGEVAIKRVVGLPGERVSLAAGDLAIDGAAVLKAPPLLAELGVPMRADPPSGPARWSMSPREILDDVAYDPGKSVVLLPVRDVGFAAVVTVEAAAGGGVRGRATVGRTVVTWRLGAGSHAIVAGRLDGHAVAVAWRLPDATAVPGRSCLPPGPPSRWSAAVPWAAADSTPERSPPLELSIEPAAGATARIERAELWRDVLYRPAADGVTEWNLAADAVFTLGDHPAASRDSRHWGPVSLRALRHHVAAVACAAR